MVEVTSSGNGQFRCNQFACVGADENGLKLEPLPSANYPATITVGEGCIDFVGDNGYHMIGHFEASQHTAGPCIRWDNAAGNKEADLEHPMFENHQGEVWFKA